LPVPITGDIGGPGLDHLYQRLAWRKRFADLHRWHTGALESIEQRDGISAAMESRFISARRSLLWRTERRTDFTAVEDRRQLGGTDWLVSGVTERHSRSEQNNEDSEQARDFHLSAPCRSGG
jgi:hypothetical protein